MAFMTAQDAYKIAQEQHTIRREKAGVFLKGEWETFLEPKIKEAAKEGRFSISYFWKRSVFQEKQVYPLTFADVLKDFLGTLGYQVEITSIQGMGIIEEIKITISWLQEEEENE